MLNGHPRAGPSADPEYRHPTAEARRCGNVRILPEHLTPEVTTGTVVEFQCEVVERLGNNTYLFYQCYYHDNVKVLLPGDVHFRPWQKINLAFDERFCMVFDENDLRISADITAPDAH